MNKIVIYAFSLILFLLISAYLGCSSRQLSADEQQQINNLYNQGQIASPREQRLIDCKVKSIETSSRSAGTIRLDKNKLEFTSSDVDPECIFEKETGQMVPVLIQDQQRIDKLIDKNLNDALDKVGK